jgi:hypothetical protein
LKAIRRNRDCLHLEGRASHIPWSVILRLASSRHVLEQLIREGQEDRQRPWFRQTTGGVLVAGVLLVLSAQLLFDMLVW